MVRQWDEEDWEMQGREQGREEFASELLTDIEKLILDGADPKEIVQTLLARLRNSV